MIKHYLLIMFIFICKMIHVHGQSGIELTTNYIIDSNVRDSVEKQIQSFKKDEVGTIYMKFYQNDSLILNTYVTKIKENQVTTMTYVSNDTIYIVSSFGMFGEFGFYIELFNDSCRIFHFADKRSKINKSDIKYTKLIPCTYKKLSLSKKPTDKDYEIVGIIELTSHDYYELDKDLLNKCKLQLKSYFVAKKYSEKINSMIKKQIIEGLKK